MTLAQKTGFSKASRQLGSAFTPQVEEAWAVYALLATTMKDAALSPAALA